MVRRAALATSAVVLIAALIYLVLLRDKDSGDSAEAQPASSSEKQQPKKADRRAESAPRAAAQMTELTIDVDPTGSLQLEGQVLDQDDQPISGARVVLSSRPPRYATSNDDGTFVFDKLVGRSYAVSAHAGNFVGGPVVASLTESSDPVIVRLRAGSTLVVEVVDEAGAAIADASAVLDSDRSRSANRRDEGQLVLEAMPPGFSTVVVSAAGFATTKVPVRVPATPGVEVSQRVTLARGITVTGVVRSAKGELMDNVRVVARSAAQPFAPVNALADGVVTNGKGQFEIAGVGFGAYQFVALHKDFAPSSSRQIAISESGHPDIEIVLQEGGRIAGRVMTGDGLPAAWASVSITTDASSRGFWGTAVQRTVHADERGEFEIAGLPKSKLSTLARSNEAASEIVPVDLSAKSRVNRLELRLSIDGTISGFVVDDDGEPVAEAQVMAAPDFWAGQEIDTAQIRGPTFATTAGDGSFTLRGLAEGGYLLQTSRSQLSLSSALGKRVKAKVGDREVELVVRKTGAVTGKVLDRKGQPAALATVEIPGAGMIPAKEGAFRIDSVPPGTYDLIVRGPDFPSKTVRDVEVKSGDATDVGSVQVERGRVVAGVVRGPDGSPVADATVAIGRQLVGDGANMVTALDSGTKDQLGLRTVTTNSSGEFRFDGIGKVELALASEHIEKGRSLGIKVPAGDADQRFDVTLQGIGSLGGTVVINGQPAPDVSVIATAKSGSMTVIATRSGIDGTFAIDRAAAGQYKVSGMFGGASMQMISKEVEVTPGERATVELSLVSGSIAVDVTIKGEEGARVDSAQVFLFDNPEVSPKTGGEVNEVFLSASEAGSARMAFSAGGKPAAFDKIKPGELAMCVIPITGDMTDPQFARRVQENAMNLAVHCAPVTIPASPAKQSLTREVPPMEPLPE